MATFAPAKAETEWLRSLTGYLPAGRQACQNAGRQGAPHYGCGGLSKIQSVDFD